MLDRRRRDKRHADLAESFEDGSSEPYWVGPYFPELPLIPNDTTLVILLCICQANTWSDQVEIIAYIFS